MARDECDVGECDACIGFFVRDKSGDCKSRYSSLLGEARRWSDIPADGIGDGEDVSSPYYEDAEAMLVCSVFIKLCREDRAKGDLSYLDRTACDAVGADASLGK